MQRAFAAMPRPDVQAIVQETACVMAQQVVGSLSPKIDDSVSRAMKKGAVNAPGISLNDAASIHRTLKETNERIDAGKSVDKVNKWNLRLELGLFVSVFVVSGLCCWIYDLRKERDELLGVEWLYRSVRSIINESDTEVIMKMEKEILSGTDEQRDSIKTLTVKREEIGIPSHNFQPHDDWKPKPQKAKEQPKNDDDSGGWFDWMFTPTENEKAAQEAVRNNLLLVNLWDRCAMRGRLRFRLF